MILLENEYLSVSFAEHGAELRSVFHKQKNREMMWSGDSAYWGRVSPVLFPIVGRVKNNTYTIDGAQYELGQHGFLRDQDFSVIREDKDQVVFAFKSNGTLKDVYPYEHTVHIGYRLDGETVCIDWSVFNDDEKTMYYSIGAHPAFAINNDEPYEFRLQGNEPAHLLRLKEGHVNTSEVADIKQPIAVTYDNFKADALIYDNVSRVDLINLKTKDTVIARFEGFDYVGLWSNTTSGEMAPFVCIEPWLGITDTYDSTGDFKKKLAIKTLEKGANIQYTYSLEFK